MFDLIVVAVLWGPLLALGGWQLFGVRRFFSFDTVKTFLWGVVFAAVPLPLLVYLQVVPFTVQEGDFMAAAWRMILIWAMVWGLAATTRMGLAIFRALWKRRPKVRPAEA